MRLSPFPRHPTRRGGCHRFSFQRHQFSAFNEVDPTKECPGRSLILRLVLPVVNVTHQQFVHGKPRTRLWTVSLNFRHLKKRDNPNSHRGNASSTSTSSSLSEHVLTMSIYLSHLELTTASGPPHPTTSSPYHPAPCSTHAAAHASDSQAG